MVKKLNILTPIILKLNMNNIDKQYLELVNHILRFGNTKQDRTGTGTKSIFGWQIRHSMKEGFPLLTTKKVAFKTMVTELLWFLRGDTNIKYLVDNGCHIWDGDCYKAYRKNMTLSVNKGYDIDRNSLKENENGFSPYTQEEFINKIKTDDEFAKKFGELGPVYGKQWRSWREGKYTNEWIVDGLEIPGGPTYWKEGIDQIANAIHLLKTDPDSRRILVSAYNVGELDQMVLPPCHYSFQFYTRELNLEERTELAKGKIVPLLGSREDSYDEAGIPKRAISLLWNQRSVDVGLGLPFNIASYALLLEIIAKEVNMVPEEVIGNLGDCHVYLNHEEGLKEQLTRIPYELPKLDKLTDYLCIKDDWECYKPNDFKILNYQSHPAIKLPLSN
jgi:thymidylate synthase